MTTTITDLPSSRALDYKAMSAIRGAGDGLWVDYAFTPWGKKDACVNFYQTNFIADQLNLLTENIDIKSSGSGATINVDSHLNLFNIIDVGPAKPHP